MNTSKWLRSVLLGSVAVSVMATGVHADELSDMKAQLEALQSRVNTIETAPSANLPAGTNLLTVRKGQSTDKRLSSMGYNVREGVIPQDRGLTISVTPTADLPAPVTEITVYGYTAGWLTWSNEQMGAAFSVPSIADNTSSQFDLYARARFGIRAKTDTAVGQVRAHMEFQATGSGGAAVAVRHMYGEWDMTPNWTLLVGQTWLTAGALDFGVATVDTSGWAGPSITRTPMVRLQYKNGPITFKAAIEDPTTHTAGTLAAAGVVANTNDYPNIAMHIKYDAAGGHQVWAAGKIADYGTRAGWMVQGGANINLGDMATFTGVVMYGKGEPTRTNFQIGAQTRFDAAGRPVKVLAAGAGLSFNVSETTTFNAIWGWTKVYNAANALTATTTNGRSVHTIHANIMWRPVKQMRLGWEVVWGKRKFVNNVGVRGKQDAIRGVFGAWFFF